MERYQACLGSTALIIWPVDREGSFRQWRLSAGPSLGRPTPPPGPLNDARQCQSSYSSQPRTPRSRARCHTGHCPRLDVRQDGVFLPVQRQRPSVIGFSRFSPAADA